MRGLRAGRAGSVSSWCGGSFVDDFIAGGNREDGGVGLVAVNIGDGDDLFAGARVIVLDDHVDREVGGVPVLVDDDDVFAGAAHGSGNGVGLADAGESEAAERLCADLFLLEVGVVGGCARGNGVWRGGGRLRQNGFPSDALEGIVEDAEATGGVVDVGGEEWRFAMEV